MTCVELQESLLESDELSGREQQEHIRRCGACSSLVKELELIASSAPALLEANEPSPRVWNCIEAALRKEGLIRPQRPARSLIPALGARWGWARWAAPAAAAMLIAVGIYVNQHSLARQLVNDTATVSSAPAGEPFVAGMNDDELMQEISGTTPAMQQQYRDDLRRANDYIRDAREAVNANPNDEEARRSLMEAYEQKSMLFDLAMDRSIP